MRPLEIKIAGGIFTFRFGPALIAAIMFAVLTGLGIWQVERLHWKENLIAGIEARKHAAPVDVSLIDASDADYRPAQAAGLLQYDHEFYLQSISKTGEGGYHVLTPMQMEDRRMLLVDRGWVPYDKKAPDMRRDGQVFGPVTVTGLTRLPRHPWGQPANRPDTNAWFWIDLPAMAKIAGADLMPFVLEADATPNPGGYPVGGQTRTELPNNHFGYALTWFGLAAALLVIYGVSGYRKLS